jgi:sugar phosphate isomerase/epimerase
LGGRHFGEAQDFPSVFRTLKAAGFNGPLTVKCRTGGATAEETMINARANRTFLEQV